MWHAVRRLWCSIAQTTPLARDARLRTRIVPMRPAQFFDIARSRIEAQRHMQLIGYAEHLGELSVVLRARGRWVDVTVEAHHDAQGTEVYMYAASRGVGGDFGACAVAIGRMWDVLIVS